MYTSGGRMSSRGGVLGTELTLHASMKLDVSDPSRVDLAHLLQRKCVTQSPSSSAWLTSINCGSGYHQSANGITTATRKIVRGIRTEIPGLYILGSSPASASALGAQEGSEVNVLRVGNMMSKKGWHFVALQKPATAQISITVRTPHPRRTFLTFFSPSPPCRL